jgi:hypothetical protein
MAAPGAAQGGAMLGFIEEIVGLVVWVVSLAVYVDLRRRGRHGFTRLVTFWVAFPGSWISMIWAREGSQPDIAPPPDDEAALLEEIRRGRKLPPGEDHVMEG